VQAQIAERKRAEETFERVQKYADSIVETMREPLIVLTRDLRVITANHSFYGTFQVTPEETEGRFVYSLGNHAWDISSLRELLEEIVPRNSRFNDFEVDHEFPVIGRRTMLLNARRIYREGQGTDMILLAFEDITDRKRSEEALTISETRYRRLFESAQDGILILDAETGQISDVNPFLVEMLGYSYEDFLGKKLWEIGPFRNIEASKTAFLELQRKGYVRYKDLPLETKDGLSIAVEFVSNVYLVNYHKVIQCNIRDITERKLIAEALQKAHNELEQRVKERTVELELGNKELQDFVFIASHDLQEPLRKVETFGDRLAARAGGSLDETSRNYLMRMRAAAATMRNLLDSLLLYSRVTTKVESIKETDLRKSVEAALSNLEIMVKEKNAHVEIGDLPIVEADRVQAIQLFQNLIENALKFGREGETPHVKIHAQQAEDENRAYDIYVEDNGIGFEEGYLDKIFLPFERLHGRSDYNGVGMGLAICRKIVERHGGNITARSTPGKGSTFIVTLSIDRAMKAPRK
jgi:two-component system, LuxR family, sensor kinase FixL